MAIHLACDVGGTFTDLVFARDGRLSVAKVPTTPEDPVLGVLNVVALAASQAGLDRRTLLSQTEVFVHATTRAINALLTGTTARTALLTTKGHRDILLLREGGRLNPYDNAIPFPKPFIPRSLTFEIEERIGPAGEVVRPLDGDHLERVIDRLETERVEAVGVCLLWSVANPVHEMAVGERLLRRLPRMAVTLSHQLNPIVREYRRASSACIDASLKPLMAHYLRDFVSRLGSEGFGGRLFMATSQGGMIDAEMAAAAPIHMLASGPAMAPVAGGHFAKADSGGTDAIVSDTGGTSFDVSLVRDGRVPWTNETWVGARFTGHMTGFPAVDVKSIGAGGGSIAHVDAGGLLHVGPASAGAVPGPVCYDRGGERATVTDCALALGYLDPDRFLGGRMTLDRSLAIGAIEKQIAAPLSLSVEAAAHAVLDLLTQKMVAAIEEVTVFQGIDPARAVLVAGGGAAGFNCVAIARRLGCRFTILPALGAALSAVGAVTSDLVFSEGRVRYLRSDAPDRALMRETLAELAEAACRFVAAAPLGTEPHIEFWAEARYPQQTWEIPVPIPSDGLVARPDIDQLIADFHAAHAALYAVSDPASPIEIITWRIRVSLGVVRVADRFEERSVQGTIASRRVHLKQEGWKDIPVHGFRDTKEDASLRGPCILETPFTTIFVSENVTGRRQPSGSIVLKAEQDS